MAMKTQKRPNVYLKEFIRELSENAMISEINAELLTEKFLTNHYADSGGAAVDLLPGIRNL